MKVKSEFRKQRMGSINMLCSQGPVSANLQISLAVSKHLLELHATLLSLVMSMVIASHGDGSLEEFAASLFLPDTTWLSWSRLLRLLLLVTSVILDDQIDGIPEDLVDTSHFFAAALHVSRSHLLSNTHSLFLGNWC